MDPRSADSGHPPREGRHLELKSYFVLYIQIVPGGAGGGSFHYTNPIGHDNRKQLSAPFLRLRSVQYGPGSSCGSTGTIGASASGSIGFSTGRSGARGRTGAAPGFLCCAFSSRASVVSATPLRAGKGLVR